MTKRLFEVAAEPTVRVLFDDVGTADEALRMNEPRRSLTSAP